MKKNDLNEDIILPITSTPLTKTHKYMQNLKQYHPQEENSDTSLGNQSDDPQLFPETPQPQKSIQLREAPLKINENDDIRELSQEIPAEKYGINSPLNTHNNTKKSRYYSPLKESQNIEQQATKNNEHTRPSLFEYCLPHVKILNNARYMLDIKEKLINDKKSIRIDLH